jgi:uncharacterized protein YqgC (DUF456 family)
MDFIIIYYIWATLLVLASGVAWVATLFALPGTWGMVAMTALFAWLVPIDDGRGVSWMTVAVVAGLAGLAEVIETAAGAAGAAKLGASKRAMILAVVGTVVGSLCGAMIALPIPLVGPILGALGGGAFGAFGGAFLGETWKGKTSDESLAIGKAALIGRLLGTFGKLLVGAVMFMVVAVDAFF